MWHIIDYDRFCDEETHKYYKKCTHFMARFCSEQYRLYQINLQKKRHIHFHVHIPRENQSV